MAVVRRKFDISTILIYLLLFLLVAVCLFPFLHIFALSFSSNHAIMSGNVGVFPEEFSTEAYQVVFMDKSMIHSLVYTVILTVVYTVMSMILTVCTAYPLTQKNLKGRNIFLVIFLITMYFSGGMIPDYLLIKELHLLDNFWALVLPGLISTYK